MHPGLQSHRVIGRGLYAVGLAMVVVSSSAAAPEVWASRAPDVVVRGRVRSDAKVRIAGAMVSVAGMNVGAITDSNGRYTLRLAGRRGTTVSLSARRLGFTQSVRTVALQSDTVTVDFTLTAVSVMLEHVVVTGHAGARRRTQEGDLSASVRGQANVAPRPASITPMAAGIAMRKSSVVPSFDPRHNTEEYARIEENAFADVRAMPRSTFSIDVDRAAYANVRRFIMTERTLPPVDAVRVEELINYFPYAYADPRGTEPVAIHTALTRAPWNGKHLLARVALQTKRVPLAHLPPNNLVFLIDVSGSMQGPQRLGLVKQSLRLLVNELRPVDRVAIVVYAGAAGLVLPSTLASEKERIQDAIERLEAGGSTAGGAGIRLAYEVAKQNHLAEGNNRIILATDGDFNVGVSSTSELVRLVEEKREQGTFLTVLGYGMGNLKDGRLEQLADKGNGNYAYVDDLLEARKVLVQEMGGTLLTVAKDVKLQIEFNPRTVRAYRLTGYENRLLRDEDFDDDRKDAGEMGAGHSVTALYEIIPRGVAVGSSVRIAAPLRYQQERDAAPAAASDELLHVSLRYKSPGGSTSRLMRHAVRPAVTRASEDVTFAAAVAGFGMILRKSPHAGSLTLVAVRELAAASVGADPDGHRRAFVRLVDEAIRVKREVAQRE